MKKYFIFLIILVEAMILSCNLVSGLNYNPETNEFIIADANKEIIDDSPEDIIELFDNNSEHNFPKEIIDSGQYLNCPQICTTAVINQFNCLQMEANCIGNWNPSWPTMLCYSTSDKRYCGINYWVLYCENEQLQCITNCSSYCEKCSNLNGCNLANEQCRENCQQEN